MWGKLGTKKEPQQVWKHNGSRATGACKLHFLFCKCGHALILGKHTPKQRRLEMKVKTIKQKVIVPASPSEVYDAFVDAKKHSAFTGSKATSDPRVGGKFTAWDGYISGKNLELENGKRIVQEWATTEWPENYTPSKLALTFKKVEGGTEISMIHSNVPAEQTDDLAEGWVEFYWKPMKEYFTKHNPAQDKRAHKSSNENDKKVRFAS
jgi:uncharacterized protein YndB with AHSA1/START domain